ncbi:MAG: hypothetical protein QOC70_2683 [Verrucomicrobiota bacterium]|jgi:hypothetical protein
MMNRAEDLFEKLIAGGEAAIDELIAGRKAEELFLDFKRSADNGIGKRLQDIDNNNFGKAISGFGNTEGGVLIWGVDCSKAKDGADVPSMKVPLQDAAAFASRLEGAISRCSVPPHSGVRNMAITRSPGVDGFVISLIPKSNHAPHQAVGGLQYHMRAGSDFVPVPHGILAGMFGRRPQPDLGIMKIVTFPEIEGDAIRFDVGLAIRNDGLGIARDIFLTVMCSSMPCPVGSLAFDAPDLENWIVVRSLGVHMSCLSKPLVRLAPDSQIMPAQLQFRISPPFASDLDVKGKVGCEGGMPHSFQIHNTSQNVERAYKGIMNKKFLGLLTDEQLGQFSRQILGANESNEIQDSPGTRFCGS